MSDGRDLRAQVETLQGRGLKAVEVYHKEGRSRRFLKLGPCVDVQVLEEEGWAVRAGGMEGAFFEAGTGLPGGDREWPRPAGEPLRLPTARVAASWVPSRDLEAPLIGERQGLHLLEAVEKSLAAELAGARLEQASLEDGASVSRLESSQGVTASWRHRLAALHLEASWAEAGVRAELYLAEVDASRFGPDELGRALADLLLVRGRGSVPERDRGMDLVLGPAVGARIVEGLKALWIGPDAAILAAALERRPGRLAAAVVDLVDDGRLADGALAAPVDGEGVPTGRTSVVSGGIFRQPLLPWWQAEEGAPGCCWRRGWRDLPRVAPGHLFVVPRPRVPPSSLVAGVSRGYYLLHAEAGVFDLREQRFALPVSGFTVRDGVARSPVTGAWLCGDVPDLLHGIRGVARDLRFFPLEGMIGSPSLLVSDLELRGAP